MSTNETKENMKPPKSARSAYVYFMADMRLKVKEANPNFTGKEVINAVNTMWKTEYKNDAERRAPYDALAASSKAEYTRAVEKRKDEIAVEKAIDDTVKKIKYYEWWDGENNYHHDAIYQRSDDVWVTLDGEPFKDYRERIACKARIKALEKPKTEFKTGTYYEVKKDYRGVAYKEIDPSILSVRKAFRARVRFVKSNKLYKRVSCSYDTCSDDDSDDGYNSLDDSHMVLITDDRYKANDYKRPTYSNEESDEESDGWIRPE